MATQYDPIAKDESLNTTETPSRNIADVLAEELEGIKNAIGGGGGSGGHTIYGADEQAMPQRAGLGFTDAHVSDNSGDDRTDVSLVQRITDANWALLDPTDESNNGFYQIGNSPLLHLGYVGNGEKKDFDAGVQSDYVEVVGDGVKTKGTLLNELLALVDTSRLNSNSCLYWEDEVLFLIIQKKDSTYVDFATALGYSQPPYTITYRVRLSSSSSFIEYTANGQSNKSSEVYTSGKKIRLYYNDAHTFDFNTKAENCVYDNTSSGLAATNVQSAIDELATSDVHSITFETGTNGDMYIAVSGKVGVIGGYFHNTNALSANTKFATCPFKPKANFVLNGTNNGVIAYINTDGEIKIANEISSLAVGYYSIGGTIII